MEWSAWELVEGFLYNFSGAQTAKTATSRPVYHLSPFISSFLICLSLLPLFLLPFPCFSPFSYRLPKMTNGDKGGERSARNVTTLDWPETRTTMISVARWKIREFSSFLKEVSRIIRISNILWIYVTIQHFVLQIFKAANNYSWQNYTFLLNIWN